jgi:hypothetical protein
LSKSYSLQTGADLYDQGKNILIKRLAKNPLEGRQSSRPESQTKTKFEIPVFPVFIEQAGFTRPAFRANDPCRGLAIVGG